MAALCYVHAGEHTLTVHHGKGKRARVVPISARHWIGDRHGTFELPKTETSPRRLGREAATRKLVSTADRLLTVMAVPA